MTRKAHNVDRARTEAAAFLDSRSYWTHNGHEYLFGRDVTVRRHELYNLVRGNCADCGKTAYWKEGELDHIKGGNTDDRCWCLHNLQWLCRDCHRTKHVRVMLGKVR
jgi:HNH endonuclease